MTSPAPLLAHPGVVPVLVTLGASVAAATLLVACLTCTYGLSVRLAGTAPPSVRAAAALVIGAWLLVASFTVLAGLGLFRLDVALPLSAAAAATALWPEPARVGRALRADLAASAAALSGVRRSRWRFLAVVVLLLVAARVLRGLAAPPLGWDALTYHLVKATRWVQTGGFAPELAPDAWGYYEYFPYAGDVLWAWAMLPTHSDQLVAPASVLTWAAVPVAAYALARALEIPSDRAALVAMVVAFLPAVAQYMTSAYIDNQALVLFLCGTLFVHRAQRGRTEDAVLAAAAMGLLAALRPVFLAPALLGLALTAWPVLRRDAPASLRSAALLACAVAAAVALPSYLRAWVERGSPLYPFAVRMGGGALEGNEQLAAVLSGRVWGTTEFAWGPFLRALFWPDGIARGMEHLNFGPLVPLLFGAGLAGSVAALRRRGTRVLALFALASSALFVAGVFSDGALGLRTAWVHVVGRFLAPAAAALIVLAGLVEGRVALGAWGAAFIVGVALSAPLGWSGEDLRALAELSAVLLPAVFLLAALAHLAGRRGRPLVGMALVAAALVAGLVAVSWARTRHRYAIYAAAGEGRAHDVHPLDRAFVAAHPIWRRLDGARGYRVAATAGFWVPGHNWYRYPLFGSRLQNVVLYVPPTRDGSVVDYWREDALFQRSSLLAWVARLLERDIDIVVSMAPEPLEGRSMAQHPELFEPWAVGANDYSRAYRFRRDAAAAWLRTHQKTQ